MLPKWESDRRFCAFDSRADSTQLDGFCTYLTRLLHCRIEKTTFGRAYDWVDRKTIRRSVSGYELVLFQLPLLPFRLTWRIGHPVSWLAATISTSSLVVKHPRWPFRQLLLILHKSAVDEKAANWALELANASRAFVTILPVIPSVPGFLPVSDDPQLQLNSLLNCADPFSVSLNNALRTLENSGIRTDLIIRRGTPVQQIQQALQEINPELMVIGADGHSRIRGWFAGEWMTTLFHWLDRPVLVAKS